MHNEFIHSYTRDPICILNKNLRFYRMGKRKLDVDQVKTLFNCSLCNKLLVNPISLICGNSICQSHLEHKTGKSFKCQVCSKKHTVPEEGFSVNKHIQRGLEMVNERAENRKVGAANMSFIKEENKENLEVSSKKSLPVVRVKIFHLSEILPM